MGDSKPLYMAAFTNEVVCLHPSSFAHQHDNYLHTTQLRWGVFHAKVRTSRVFVRDATFLRPLALALLGGTGDEMLCHIQEHAISVGGKPEMSVKVPPRHGALLRQLRELIEDAVNRVVDSAHGNGRDQVENGNNAKAADALAERGRQALELLAEMLTAEAAGGR